MNHKRACLLTTEDIKKLVTARHPDVFSLLGMHRTSEKKGVVIRTLLPGAKTVSVIHEQTKKEACKLSLIDAVGLFETYMPEQVECFSYQLQITYDNNEMVINDPYCFPSLLNADDVYLFCEGTLEHVYQWMGAHSKTCDGISGMLFVVWAPDALRVSVVGDFNCWNGASHVMRKHPAAGLWEIFVPSVTSSVHYKYEIVSICGDLLPLKADPYSQSMQHPPETASITPDETPYQWSDDQWMSTRSTDSNHYHGPVSIYEVHLGSWKRSHDEKGDNRYLTYKELADDLIPYVLELGFTHLQLMPVSEFPFDGSWGYQPIGLFAPTSRFGTPENFKDFVDRCHQAGIGLLLDWVPGHFPTDIYGTGQFDGSCLYEHEDVRKGFHPDWNTLIYNYGRNEIKSYLISNAIYWLEQYHIDGLRVDAVASMLYLDYSRKEGEWIANKYGGRENLEAIDFLKEVNSRVYYNFPGAMMVAEESTAWPGVSRSVDNGGLGFGFKWNMGWMNDTLNYMERDPIYRQHHHNEMTFGLIYSFSENFILPISHDEVVHGKRSLLNKMPGDRWQKFANLRAYYGFMWTHPGKKLLFMGCEFAQNDEWDHDKSLDWHLLDCKPHEGIQHLVKDLNHAYKQIPALHELDCKEEGFEWIDSQNSQHSIFIYLRKGKVGTKPALVVVNMTPSTHKEYLVGVPLSGFYQECLNTDSEHYGGTGVGNFEGVHAQEVTYGGFPYQLSLVVPPLATLIFELQS